MVFACQFGIFMFMQKGGEEVETDEAYSAQQADGIHFQIGPLTLS